jgi:hypothetical protein
VEARPGPGGRGHVPPDPADRLDDEQPAVAARRDLDHRARREALGGSLLAYRHYSIATNYSQASYAVPRFGIASSATGGFPHGFEIQVVGPASARQVLLRIVVVSTNNAGHKAHAETQTVIVARDL